MEIILNSNEHKINDHCLRYNLKKLSHLEINIFL